MAITIISSVQAFHMNAYLEKFVTDEEQEESFPNEVKTALLACKTNTEDNSVSELAQTLQKLLVSLKWNDVLFIFRGKIPQTAVLKNEKTEKAVACLKRMGIKSLINGAVKVSTDSMVEVVENLLWLGKRNKHAIYCGGIGKPYVLGISRRGHIGCFFYSFSEADEFLKKAVEMGFKR